MKKDDSGPKKPSTKPMRARSSSGTSKSENATLQRLAGTPFKTAAALNKAEEKIRRQIWDELTTAKFYESLTERDDFAFFKKTFEAGVRWAFGKDSENVSRFYIFKGALVIELNDEMKALEHSEPFVAAIIKGMSEALLDCYFKAMRILPTDDKEAPAKK